MFSFRQFLNEEKKGHRFHGNQYTRLTSSHFRKFDTPGIKPQDILDKFEPEVATEIAEKIKLANSLVPSIEKYSKKDSNGNVIWDSERSKLHNKIIGSILTPEAIANATPKSGKPTFVILGGRGGCLSEDHEYLTPTGWKKISEYSGEENVLVFDPKTNKSWFEIPSNFVNLPCDEMFHFKSRGVDLVVSEEHTILFNKKYNPEVWRKSTAKEISIQHNDLKSGWDGMIPCVFPAPENSTGIDLSDDELRLMVAVCADGNFPSKTTNHCRMSFRKERKIERIQELLKNCGIEYTMVGMKDRETEVRIGFYAPENNKRISSYWKANAQQLKIISEEILHWDGWTDKCGSWIFSTIDETDKDFVSYLFATQGRRSSFYFDERVGTGWSPIWRVSGAKNGGFAGIRYDGKKTEIEKIIPTDGRKYCFTVSTGFFITRRNDCICVTGNSGKSAFTNGKLKEFDTEHFITLDSDEIKKQLIPPYEGWNAAQVHVESSYIFEQVTKIMKELGVNFIHDSTLKTDCVKHVIMDLKKSGYDVQGHYMHVPREVSATRAVKRYLGTGPENRKRLVPIEVILDNKDNEKNFDSMKKYFDKWSAWDNQVKKGELPQLISRSK